MTRFSRKRWLTALSHALSRPPSSSSSSQSSLLSSSRRRAMDASVAFMTQECQRSLEAWAAAAAVSTNPILSELHLQDAMWMMERLLSHHLSTPLLLTLLHPPNAIPHHHHDHRHHHHHHDPPAGTCDQPFVHHPDSPPPEQYSPKTFLEEEEEEHDYVVDEDEEVHNDVGSIGSPPLRASSSWSALLSEACTRALSLHRHSDLLTLLHALLHQVADTNALLPCRHRLFLLLDTVQNSSFPRPITTEGSTPFPPTLNALEDALIKILGSLPHSDVEQVFIEWINKQEEVAPEALWPDLRPGFHQWYDCLTWTHGFIEACCPT